MQELHWMAPLGQEGLSNTKWRGEREGEGEEQDEREGVDGLA